MGKTRRSRKQDHKKIGRKKQKKSVTKHQKNNNNNKGTTVSIFHGNRFSLRFPFEDRTGYGRKPDGWIHLPAYGEVVKGTRIIPLKTPFGGSNFRAEEFIVFMDMLGCPVSSVLDLNQSKRFYAPLAVKSLGVRYYKRSLPGGKAVANSRQLDPLSELLHKAHKEHPDKYIAVHCSHGYNRTGLVICWYLCKYLGLSVTESLRCFAAARPPGIYRSSPVEVLFRHFAKPEESLPALLESIGKKPSDVPGAPLFRGWEAGPLRPVTGEHIDLATLEKQIPAEHCNNSNPSIPTSSLSSSSLSSSTPSSSSSAPQHHFYQPPHIRAHKKYRNEDRGTDQKDRKPRLSKYDGNRNPSRGRGRSRNRNWKGNNENDENNNNDNNDNNNNIHQVIYPADNNGGNGEHAASSQQDNKEKHKKSKNKKKKNSQTKKRNRSRSKSNKPPKKRRKN